MYAAPAAQAVEWALASSVWESFYSVMRVDRIVRLRLQKFYTCWYEKVFLRHLKPQASQVLKSFSIAA